MTTPEDLERLRGHFSTMARIRAFEQLVARHFRNGDIHGFVHVSIGQEGIASGACGALEEADLITTTHRGHGHCIAKGADPTAMFAELFGRSTGLCGGKGGSMHIADPSLGILGANGIVGAGVPIAVGGALAAATSGDGRVALSFFGEGAVHSGAFHEGMTLAVAWQLPVIFLCENNGYAEFTRSDAWRGPNPCDRAAAYAMPVAMVDGSDPLLVEEEVGKARARAADGAGPSFIEARAVRVSGHYEGDPQRYRPTDEDVDQRDPLIRAAARLDEGVAVELNEAAEAEMESAVKSALSAPYPPAEAVLEDVYA